MAMSVLSLSIVLGPVAPVYAQSQEKPVIPPSRETKAPAVTTNEPDRPATSRPSNVLITGEEDYRVGAGDQLDIKVADAEELSGGFRVRADGTIKLHFIGRMLVANKTTDEISREIADSLRGRYLFEPRVSINVTELNSRSIYLQGAVARPGVFQVDSRPHLLQLLTMAGGLQSNHGTTAFIIRRNKLSDEDIKAHEAALKRENEKAAAGNADGGKGETSEASAKTAQSEDSEGERASLLESEWLAKQYSLIKININGLFRGRFDQNMFLQPGDIINIPSTEMFFIAGQVKAPGTFPLKEGTSVRQGVALAQGFTPTASPGKGIIFRENPETGKRTELAVNLGDIMSGKKEDMLLYPNDVVVVPASGFKTVALPLINTAISLVVTTMLMRAIGF